MRFFKFLLRLSPMRFKQTERFPGFQAKEMANSLLDPSRGWPWDSLTEISVKAGQMLGG